jgi:hypothetical protein
VIHEDGITIHVGGGDAFKSFGFDAVDVSPVYDGDFRDMDADGILKSLDAFIARLNAMRVQLVAYVERQK